MSAKGNNKKGRPPVPGDRYYTPDWCVRQLVTDVLPRVVPGPVDRVLEPSAGTGAILRGVRPHWPDARIHAVDNNPGAEWPEADLSAVTDFETFHARLARRGRVYDVSVGNPPYGVAQEHTGLSRDLAWRTVFLLRQGFLSSAKRAEWFCENPPAWVFMLANRPSFGVPPEYLVEYPEEEFGKWGGDSADYCWVCWDERRDVQEGDTRMVWLPPVPVEERARE